MIYVSFRTRPVTEKTPNAFSSSVGHARRRPRVVFVARIASSAVRLAVARAFVASDRTDASNAANASSSAEPEPTPPSKRVPSGEAKENAADARNAFFFPAGSAAHHASLAAANEAETETISEDARALSSTSGDVPAVLSSSARALRLASRTSAIASATVSTSIVDAISSGSAPSTFASDANASANARVAASLGVHASNAASRAHARATAARVEGAESARVNRDGSA